MWVPRYPWLHGAEIIAVDHGHVALACRYCLDLVAVSTLGRAGEVGDQSL
jgi:hypothetical protein